MAVNTARSGIGGESAKLHWLDHVRDILSERFREPVTMACIAREVGVHRVYLSAAFRKRHGCTARAFVRTLRLNLAKERLAHSGDTLRRIASACGFCDQGAFSKTFKQDTGLTPSAYRLQFQNSIVPEPDVLPISPRSPDLLNKAFCTSAAHLVEVSLALPAETSGGSNPMQK